MSIIDLAVPDNINIAGIENFDIPGFLEFVLVLMTYGMGKLWLLKHESSKTIIYEKIDLIKPENYERLLNDIYIRTGITKIKRIETDKIDFLKEICTLKVFYESTQVNDKFIRF
jgi:hypothetical protein